eukprot:TRINITY_DN7820_c0_g1_i1.p1 TRINITY_DN7820_c0_g1~~TRINITY_DN7820_c0_g1_i1.p1  ORF type:complete len:255 (-),score=34.54 TRINITY_DN7820_c0_g1_i1:117-881(-)
MMNRRRRGIQNMRRKDAQEANTRAHTQRIYKDVSGEIATMQASQMREQMEELKGQLELFASKHKQDINKDPELRKHFHKMCLNIGVDPLASGKGFWSSVLGVGDFYYELGVQIIEVSIATRSRNGGIIDIDELLAQLVQCRPRQGKITTHDIEAAIAKLKILGSGFRLLKTGQKTMVQSVPCELNTDHTNVLTAAADNGFVTLASLHRDLGWAEKRSHEALKLLLQEGMVWIDSQGDEVCYWIPGWVVRVMTDG